MSQSIAYQGAPGAFSHRASLILAKHYLAGEQTQLLALKRFSELFEHAKSDAETFACLPIDNSSIGSISENYDLIWDSGLEILAQYYMPIHHQLLSLPGAKPEEIREVYSHPAALEQCRKLFQKYPQMQEHPYFDTAAASKFIKEKNSTTLAAIGSEQAAKEYGLETILKNIEDYPLNQTRFVLVGKNKHAKPPKEFPVRLSFGLEGARDLNAITALSPLLGEFIQLTKIEARPVPERPWHFRLFADLIIEKGHTDRLSKKDSSSSDHVESSVQALKDQLSALIPGSRFFGYYYDFSGKGE